MTYRSDTRAIGGTFEVEEDIEQLENTVVGRPLVPRSIYANPFWDYSATMEDRGEAGSADSTPGLKYLGPSGLFIIGFNELNVIEGTITGEANDEMNVQVYVNGVNTIESDEGTQEYPAGEADVEFNLADTILTLETGDVVHITSSMAASNEDDPDSDWNVTNDGAWNIRPVVGQQSVAGGGAATGALYFSSSAATTITTAGTPVKAAGTTAAIASLADATDSVDVTVATTNRLTYTGNQRKRFFLNAQVSLSHADVEGATQRCGAQLYLNGAAITGAEVQADVEANGRSMVTVSAVIEMGLDDFVEVFVSNEESTANVTVQQGTMSIQAL